MAKAAIDLDALSTAERLDLLEELWDSLTKDPSSIPVTAAQRDELDRRLDDIERNGATGIPWEEVLARLEHPDR
jgi:putative addiction module component (TIGR02574 family)